MKTRALAAAYHARTQGLYDWIVALLQQTSPPEEAVGWHCVVALQTSQRPLSITTQSTLLQPELYKAALRALNTCLGEGACLYRTTWRTARRQGL